MSPPSRSLALTGEELARLSLDPASAPGYSPLSDTPALLVDGASDLTAGAQPRVAAWLRELPAPSIAIGNGALAELCDTTAADEDQAHALIEHIRAAPRAASILVQLLRLTGHLSIEDALTAESLAYATLQGGAEFRAWLASHRADAPPRPDPGPAVLVERDGDALRLTLNRPSNRNAMTVEMRDALCEALQLALADDTIRELRIDARGKCFSTGGDLREFGSAPDAATAHAVRGLALPGRLLARCAERATVHVHGACIGSGIEFPAFAARVEAHADAWFQLPELNYGLIPGAGGCVGIARRIGRQRCAWMVLSGQRIDAPTARGWGLVDAIQAS